jgi:hypothetical protein
MAMLPPCAVTSARAMKRPRPVPWFSRRERPAPGELEDGAQLLGRDPHAGVAHLHRDAAGATAGADRHAAAGGREGHGVAQDVGQRPLECHGIRGDDAEGVVDRGLVGDAGAVGRIAELVGDGVDQRGEIDRLARHRELAGLDLGEREIVRDQRQHGVGVRLDAPRDPSVPCSTADVAQAPRTRARCRADS